MFLQWTKSDAFLFVIEVKPPAVIYSWVKRTQSSVPCVYLPSIATYLRCVGKAHSKLQSCKGERAIFPYAYVDMQKRGQHYSASCPIEASFPVNLPFFSLPWSFNFLPQRFLHFSFLQTSGNRLKLISSDASESAGLAALQSAFRCHFGIKIYQLCPIVYKRDLGRELCMRLDQTEM